MHMVLCEPHFGKRMLTPAFISVPPPLYKGPDDEVSETLIVDKIHSFLF